MTATADRLVSFNINCHILVKLKENGYEHWKAFDDSYTPEAQQKSLDYYKSKAVLNGFMKFQMWEFMQIFGSTVRMGVNLMFETTIFFAESDLKK